MEPRGAASRHWAEQACRSAGFEPDVRFETADLQAQIRLIESGNAVALMPDLVWTGRGTTAQLMDLPGKPHRTVFTSVRRSSAKRPGHPGRPRDPGGDGRLLGRGAATDDVVAAEVVEASRRSVSCVTAIRHARR